MFKRLQEVREQAGERFQEAASPERRKSLWILVGGSFAAIVASTDTHLHTKWVQALVMVLAAVFLRSVWSRVDRRARAALILAFLYGIFFTGTPVGQDSGKTAQQLMSGLDANGQSWVARGVTSLVRLATGHQQQAREATSEAPHAKTRRHR